jgi:DNA-binding NarL/FixJ family response regulator
VFEATNHPITDIAIMDGDEVVHELQLKATDSSSYISATIEEHPDIEVVATTEVASGFDADLVTDSGIADAALEQAVTDTLLDEAVNPVSPISVIGWLFGLPF